MNAMPRTGYPAGKPRDWFVGAVLLSLLPAPMFAADAPVWLREVEPAKADAKAPGRDLFLLFTGVGWCVPCMEFDQKVLKQTAFLEAARKNYTLVEFDHTFGETPAEKDRKAWLEALEKRYLVNAFPTVVLADSSGMPYAVSTGGELEMPKMLEWMATARAARDRRDSEFRAANGADYAARLHQGIQAVAGLFGTLDERGDDPVLVYYKDQIDEIGRLDKDGTIRKAYDARRAERDSWAASQAVYKRLREFDAANDYAGAIKFIDESLKATTDPAQRFRLERTRINFLERDNQDEEALRSARRLLEQTNLTTDERYNMKFHEAANLFRLGKVNEGVAVWDKLVADADTPEKRVRRLHWKASMIPLKTHRELKMAAWTICRAEAPKGSDHWLTATFFLADDARKAGKPRDALALFHEELDADQSDWCRTFIAECHLDLGESDKAREWLEKAEAGAAKAKASPREGDRQMAGRVEARIKELRSRLKSE